VPDNRENTKGIRSVVAVAVAGVLCCAGPVLFVALGLGAGGSALGAALGRPVVLIPALVVVVVASTALIVRSRRH